MTAASLHKLLGSMSRIVSPALAAWLALVLLFAVYQNLDFDRFVRALVASDWKWLLGLVGVILLEQLVRAWKWHQILRGVKSVRVPRLFGAILASFGIQLVVPLPVTPLVRSWFVARLENLPVATLLSTIAIDRYVDAIVFAMFILFVGLSGAVPYVDGDLRVVLSVVAVVQGLTFAGFALGLYRARTVLRQDDADASKILDWISRKGGRRFEGLRHAMVAGIVWPKEAWRQAGIVGASFAMKLLAASQFYWAALALGITISPMDFIFLMVCSGLALFAAMFLRVPGVYFFALVYAFEMVGVGLEQAFAMLLLIRVASMACMLGPGFVFAWNRFIQIRQKARRGAERFAAAT